MTTVIAVVALAAALTVWYKVSQVERDLNNITGALMKKGLIREEDF